MSWGVHTSNPIFTTKDSAMHTRLGGSRQAGRLAILVAPVGCLDLAGRTGACAAEVTLKGSMVCNGACIPDPKTADHVLVLFAIDGSREIRAEVDRIVAEFYPEKG